MSAARIVTHQGGIRVEGPTCFEDVPRIAEALAGAAFLDLRPMRFVGSSGISALAHLVIKHCAVNPGFEVCAHSAIRRVIEAFDSEHVVRFAK